MQEVATITDRSIEIRKMLAPHAMRIPKQMESTEALSADKLIDYLNTIDTCLAQTCDAAEAILIRDRAEMIQFLTRKMDLDNSIKNRATASVIRSQARIGELLGALPKQHGARPPDTGFRGETPSYDDLGISKTTAYRYQTMAKLPATKREAFITEALETGSELTSGGMLAYAKNVLKMDSFTSSASNKGLTPKHIIKAVIEVMGGIDLDPCSNSRLSPNVPAKRQFIEAENGLERQWHGKVFMNPPYGDEIPYWIDKLIYEYLEGRTTQAIALTPSRTDTQWFRALRRYPRCFLWGRLEYGGYDNPALFPSMLVYMGENTDEFTRVMGLYGDIYVRLCDQHSV